MDENLADSGKHGTITEICNYNYREAVEKFRKYGLVFKLGNKMIVVKTDTPFVEYDGKNYHSTEPKILPQNQKYVNLHVGQRIVLVVYRTVNEMHYDEYDIREAQIEGRSLPDFEYEYKNAVFDEEEYNKEVNNDNYNRINEIVKGFDSSDINSALENLETTLTCENISKEELNILKAAIAKEKNESGKKNK